MEGRKTVVWWAERKIETDLLDGWTTGGVCAVLAQVGTHLSLLTSPRFILSLVQLTLNQKWHYLNQTMAKLNLLGMFKIIST